MKTLKKLSLMTKVNELVTKEESEIAYLVFEIDGKYYLMTLPFVIREAIIKWNVEIIETSLFELK